MELFVAQLLNGLVYGVLLFLMAAGLSLIFGLMNVVSLAHGSFFMLGAFIGLSIFQLTGSFWAAFVLAPIPVVVLGILLEALFLRPLYHRGHMAQVLLTSALPSCFLIWYKPYGGAACSACQHLHPCRAQCRSALVFSPFIGCASSLSALPSPSYYGCFSNAVASVPWCVPVLTMRRWRLGLGPTFRRCSAAFSALASRSLPWAASRRRLCSASIPEWIRTSLFRRSSSLSSAAWAACAARSRAVSSLASAIPLARHISRASRWS